MHLILLQYYLGGLDYCSYGVADLDTHFFGASSGYDAFDEILPYLNHYVCHDSAELEFSDLAFESVARR